MADRLLTPESPESPGSNGSPDSDGSPDASDRPPASGVPTFIAAAAGGIAALVALAVSELVSSLAGTEQSLVASVGTTFIDRFAASLKTFAISVFGTNDKPALIIGIIVVSTVIGMVLGPLALRRSWVAIVGFGAFGVVGVIASMDDPQISLPLAVLAASLAVISGAATLLVLLQVAVSGHGPVRTSRSRYATRRSGGGIDRPTNPAASRRAFFGWAGAAGAFAAVAAASGRALTGRSRIEEIRSGVKLPTVPTVATPTTAVPADAPMGVGGLSPYYVPNQDFYRIDTALIVPQVDPADWSLKVTGLVERPFTLTFDELLAMPMVEEAVTLSCVSNEVGGDLVGNALWQGVPLTSILDRAGVRPVASQIVGVSTDGFTAGFPTEAALDGRVGLIAVGMNGEPLPIPHGFPARLVIAGLYGYVSAVKWLSEIRLTRLEDEDGYWIPRGWSKEAPVKTMSRIDVPRSLSKLPAAATKVAGVAWAPTRGIERVEVQVDDGPWQEARLGPVVSDNTWVQWVLDWEPSGGKHEIRVRATDKSGSTQTDRRASPDPDGATGWHTISVTVDG